MDWKAMTPADGGRHCHQCAKVVVDFTAMSTPEVVEYLRSHSDVCGRIQKSRLSPSMPMKTVTGNAFFSWWRGVIAGLVLAFPGVTKNMVRALGMPGPGARTAAVVRTQTCRIRARLNGDQPPLTDSRGSLSKAAKLFYQHGAGKGQFLSKPLPPVPQKTQWVDGKHDCMPQSDDRIYLAPFDPDFVLVVSYTYHEPNSHQGYVLGTVGVWEGLERLGPVRVVKPVLHQDSLESETDLMMEVSLLPERIQLHNQVQLFPNPARNQFNLLLDAPMDFRLEASDMEGRPVWSRTYYRTDRVTEFINWPPAVYLLTLIHPEHGEMISTVKLVVQ